MKSAGEILFQILCLGLAAVLLGLSLFWNARRAECNDQVLALRTECEQLRAEDRLLQKELSGSRDLETLARYAEEELGMESLCADQIIPVG